MASAWSRGPPGWIAAIQVSKDAESAPPSSKPESNLQEHETTGSSTATGAADEPSLPDRPSARPANIRGQQPRGADRGGSRRGRGAPQNGAVRGGGRPAIGGGAETTRPGSGSLSRRRLANSSSGHIERPQSSGSLEAGSAARDAYRTSLAGRLSASSEPETPGAVPGTSPARPVSHEARRPAAAVGAGRGAFSPQRLRGGLISPRYALAVSPLRPGSVSASASPRFFGGLPANPWAAAEREAPEQPSVASRHGGSELLDALRAAERFKYRELNALVASTEPSQTETEALWRAAEKAKRLVQSVFARPGELVEVAVGGAVARDTHLARSLSSELDADLEVAAYLRFKPFDASDYTGLAWLAVAMARLQKHIASADPADVQLIPDSELDPEEIHEGAWSRRRLPVLVDGIQVDLCIGLAGYTAFHSLFQHLPFRSMLGAAWVKPTKQFSERFVSRDATRLIRLAKHWHSAYLLPATQGDFIGPLDPYIVELVAVHAYHDSRGYTARRQPLDASEVQQDSFFSDELRSLFIRFLLKLYDVFSGRASITWDHIADFYAPEWRTPTQLLCPNGEPVVMSPVDPSNNLLAHGRITEETSRRIAKATWDFLKRCGAAPRAAEPVKYSADGLDVEAALVHAHRFVTAFQDLACVQIMSQEALGASATPPTDATSEWASRVESVQRQSSRRFEALKREVETGAVAAVPLSQLLSAAPPAFDARAWLASDERPALQSDAEEPSAETRAFPFVAALRSPVASSFFLGPYEIDRLGSLLRRDELAKLRSTLAQSRSAEDLLAFGRTDAAVEAFADAIASGLFSAVFWRETVPEVQALYRAMRDRCQELVWLDDHTVSQKLRQDALTVILWQAYCSQASAASWSCPEVHPGLQSLINPASAVLLVNMRLLELGSRVRSPVHRLDEPARLALCRRLDEFLNTEASRYDGLIKDGSDLETRFLFVYVLAEALLAELYCNEAYTAELLATDLAPLLEQLDGTAFFQETGILSSWNFLLELSSGDLASRLAALQNNYQIVEKYLEASQRQKQLQDVFGVTFMGATSSDDAVRRLLPEWRVYFNSDEARDWFNSTVDGISSAAGL